MFIKTNLSPLTKLCLAGLFIALATILQKVVAINYIAAIPFLRISFGGPAVIIFSSICLGPWYGLLVGAGSDVLGYIALDFSGYAYFPQVTAIYAMLGFVPYFVFSLLKNIKSKKAMFIIESSTLTAVFVASLIYIISTPDIRLYSSIYTLETWQKILIPSVVLIFVIFQLLFTLFYNKHEEKQQAQSPLNAYQLSFGLTFIELFVMVVFGTLMKGWAFGFQTYPAILMCQIITMFINIPLNIVLITMLLKIMRKRFINIA